MKVNTANKPKNNLHGAIRCLTACRAGLGGNRRYIAQDNPHRALTFIAELRSQCAKIASTPKACRLRPELGENIRSSAFGNYAIFFQDNVKAICILRVLHSAMDIEARFSEE